MTLREEGLRSLDNIEFRKSLHQEDKRRLIADSSDFVDVPCPVCGEERFAPYGARDGFEFRECPACQTVYVSPRPDEPRLMRYYQESLAEKYWNEHVYPKSEASRITHLIKPRVVTITALCNKYDVGRTRAVDIGAGTGTFAAEMLNAKRFDSIDVFEPDPLPARICVDKGLTVHAGLLEQMSGDLPTDLATSFEVLEHVFSPRGHLLATFNLLRPGGLFVMTTPNIHGFDLAMLRLASDNITAPNHLNYFNPASLALLLKDIGFEVLEISTPGKLDVELVRTKVKAGDFSLDEHHFLKRIIMGPQSIADSFQNWLAENLQSSHLWAVARKPHGTR